MDSIFHRYHVGKQGSHCNCQSVRWNESSYIENGTFSLSFTFHVSSVIKLSSHSSYYILIYLTQLSRFCWRCQLIPPLS